MTRTPAPHRPPVAVTIAGSDSGGGAGIQADLKTMEAHGAFGTSVLTAVTAQNTQGVLSSHVLPTSEIEAQLDAVAADFDLRAAKTGMLAERSVIDLVTGFAADFDQPLVVDPVMVAASGDRLLDPAAEDAYEDLISHATVVTPNADEAEVLTGISVEDESSAIEAGHELVEIGAEFALVKGGHVSGETVVDVLVGADQSHRFAHPRVETEATHGTGCSLSAAIAAKIADGVEIVDAVSEGVAFVERAVRYPLGVGTGAGTGAEAGAGTGAEAGAGTGAGAVHHLVELREQAARHSTAEEVEKVVNAFSEMDVSPLVPEVGMNVVGATPFAERTDETAAVEGRIVRTLSGAEPVRGVRFGASGHMARYLLAVREFEPERRFACNVRFGENVEAALDQLEWPTVELDRQNQPDNVAGREGSTMQWSAKAAYENTEQSPVVVYDRGAVGKEPMCRLTATDAETLVNRVESLLKAV